MRRSRAQAAALWAAGGVMAKRAQMEPAPTGLRVTVGVNVDVRSLQSRLSPEQIAALLAGIGAVIAATKERA